MKTGSGTAAPAEVQAASKAHADGHVDDAGPGHVAGHGQDLAGNRLAAHGPAYAHQGAHVGHQGVHILGQPRGGMVRPVTSCTRICSSPAG